ncbi:MAG: RnfABCDGE type electron transport complex subunit B [Candidatus Omnitrophota bacterium]|nr:RnfABCDGE type electron transport complex subunit B [Candidatus Omnitrophota bacterium]
MVIASILTMVGLGVFFAGVLAAANQKLKVKENPEVEELSGKLPGLNCGACGFPSCHEFAKGIVEHKEAAVNSTCRAGGPEAIELVSKIAGIKKEPAKKVAVVFCGAKDKDKTRKAVYKGIKTCRSADIIFGSGMYCEYGCIGFGDCAAACPFDAIKMVDGLPVVDASKCTACGKCLEACPRGIIELMPYDVDNLVITACKSRDAGAFVRKACSVGCIACKICERLSGGVFVVEDNLSKMKVKRMKENVNWDEIIKKCPTNTIVRIK